MRRNYKNTDVVMPGELRGLLESFPVHERREIIRQAEVLAARVHAANGSRKIMFGVEAALEVIFKLNQYRRSLPPGQREALDALAGGHNALQAG